MSQAKGSRGKQQQQPRVAIISYSFSSRIRDDGRHASKRLLPQQDLANEAGRGRAKLAQSSSSGHSGSEARRNQNAVKGGEEHTQPNGTRAAHTPGGKQSGVRKVNRERDLKVKEMGTCPPFLEGGTGDTWLCANEGGRQKWLYRSPEFSEGDSRRRVRLLLAVLAGDLVTGCGRSHVQKQHRCVVVAVWM